MTPNDPQVIPQSITEQTAQRIAAALERLVQVIEDAGRR